MVKLQGRTDNPSHTVRIVYVDKEREPTIYKNVDGFYYSIKVWTIKFMDGRRVCLQFDLVLRIETLEPNE